jgi:thiamine-phosphate pyrophosphorylase
MITYAITDPSTLNFSTLKDDLERFSKKANMILYRDKDTLNYHTRADLFIKETKKFNFQRVLLHRDIELAVELDADIHLTSLQLDKIEFAKSKGLFVVVSTHNPKEAEIAQSRGADMITYSPIFATPNKGRPIRVEAIESLRESIDIPIIALGGIITKEQIDSAISSGALGFASIRYFR